MLACQSAFLPVAAQTLKDGRTPKPMGFIQYPRGLDYLMNVIFLDEDVVGDVSLTM